MEKHKDETTRTPGVTQEYKLVCPESSTGPNQGRGYSTRRHARQYTKKHTGDYTPLKLDSFSGFSFKVYEGKEQDNFRSCLGSCKRVQNSLINRNVNIDSQLIEKSIELTLSLQNEEDSGFLSKPFFIDEKHFFILYCIRFNKMYSYTNYVFNNQEILSFDNFLIEQSTHAKWSSFFKTINYILRWVPSLCDIKSTTSTKCDDSLSSHSHQNQNSPRANSEHELEFHQSNNNTFAPTPLVDLTPQILEPVPLTSHSTTYRPQISSISVGVQNGKIQTRDYDSCDISLSKILMDKILPSPKCPNQQGMKFRIKEDCYCSLCWEGIRTINLDDLIKLDSWLYDVDVAFDHVEENAPNFASLSDEALFKRVFNVRCDNSTTQIVSQDKRYLLRNGVVSEVDYDCENLEYMKVEAFRRLSMHSLSIVGPSVTLEKFETMGVSYVNRVTHLKLYRVRSSIVKSAIKLYILKRTQVTGNVTNLITIECLQALQAYVNKDVVSLPLFASVLKSLTLRGEDFQ